MTLHQMRKELNELKESVKTRPLSVLLKYEAASLTDEELNRVIKESSPFVLPVDFLLESIERKCKDIFNFPDSDFEFSSIDDIPDEYIQKMKENLKNVPAVSKEGTGNT